jgi:HD-GYP domain-containing protein (c-di-GMP phosphodiesterase class II)
VSIAVPITVSVGVALFPDHGGEWLDVIKIADERLLQAKTGKTGEATDEEVAGDVPNLHEMWLGAVKDFLLLDSLVTAVDNKDRYTRRHSEDIREKSLLIAREMGLTQEEQDTLAKVALL